MSRIPVPLRPLARLLLWLALLGALHELAAWALREIDLVSRLLAPTPAPSTYVALAALVFFYLLRFGLVFVAPAMTAVAAVRAFTDLLASGEAPPVPPPAPSGREMKRPGRA